MILAILLTAIIFKMKAQAPDKSLADIAMSKRIAKDGDTSNGWLKGGLISLNIAQGKQ